MRNIENRLRKLALKLHPPQELVVGGIACVAHGLAQERKTNLAAGERVVIDWYQSANFIFWGRERISNDPADQGRGCKRGGYLLDVIQELHEVCSHRVPEGSCHDCRGTPVAEGRRQESSQVE